MAVWSSCARSPPDETAALPVTCVVYESVPMFADLFRLARGRFDGTADLVDIGTRDNELPPTATSSETTLIPRRGSRFAAIRLVKSRGDNRASPAGCPSTYFDDQVRTICHEPITNTAFQHVVANHSADQPDTYLRVTWSVPNQLPHRVSGRHREVRNKQACPMPHESRSISTRRTRNRRGDSLNQTDPPAADNIARNPAPSGQHALLRGTENSVHYEPRHRISVGFRSEMRRTDGGRVPALTGASPPAAAPHI